MAQLAQKTRVYEWLDYYDRFPYFSPEKVREGCYPRMMEHPQPVEKAIVLVHGLSDSPYFMSAIGNYFYERLGYNVYIPLLHCHGLKEPKGMEGVKLDEWKKNVSFAIELAASRCEHISVGGLSTGGALSYYMAANKPEVSDTLYLFSAALDLAGGPHGLMGEVHERLLRTFLADILDDTKPLIGENPYRYSHIDMDGARELAYLIEETDAISARFNPKMPFSQRVFAAHSESDTTANITGIEALQRISNPNRFHFFRIPKEVGVSHPSLVLKEPIQQSGDLLEKPNPLFPAMMQAIADFG